MRHLGQLVSVSLEVFLEVLEGFYVRAKHLRLAVGYENDAVGALEHQLAGLVVEHLAGNRVELNAGLHSPDLAEVYGQKIEELYEKVKKSGEKVPEDTVQWAKEEIRKIGTWEYKVVILKFDNDSVLEEELNKLGKERWECFWVKETDTSLKFYFKRAVRSHLRSIPLGEILRIIS